MKIVEVKTDRITPDPTQPRTSIDELDLREMAQSILTTGIINPIEVDKNFVIVTGERRWRASKIAGLKTVPVRIINLTKEDRFMRQVVENIHHNTMSDWDTANALKKLIQIGWVPGTSPSPKTGPQESDKGMNWLSRKIGKSTAYIREKFAILEASEEFKKNVKSGKLSGGFIRVITRTPEKFKKTIEEKILNNEFSTREGALELVSALKREEANPHVIKKLLDTDYSKFNGTHETENAITKISPRLHELVAKSYEPSQEISKIAENLKEWIRNNPKNKVGTIHAPRVVINLNFMKTLIDEWFKGEAVKEIELSGNE